MEIYKPIASNHIYHVSNMGNVKNIKTNRILKPGTQTLGYKHVILCNKGVKQQIFVHRLVAETFIPNPDNKPWVDHINNNPADNSLENLRWATKSENQYNRSQRTKTQTGVRNIRFGRNKQFRVYCSHNLKRVYVGQFDTLDKAIDAYNEKVKELHGAFAKLISKEI